MDVPKNKTHKSMKLNQKIIAIILLLCTSIWLGTKASQHYKQRKLTKSYKLSQKVSKIIISENNTTFTITKNKNNTWLIDGISANHYKVNTMLSSIETLGTKKRISKNKDNHPKYKVTDLDKTITLKQGTKTIVSLIIGNQGPTWDSTYIRLLPKHDVYVLNQPLANQITSRKNDWKELKIYSFLEKEIIKIDINTNQKALSLSLENHEWINTQSNKTITIPSINSILKPLSQLTASAINPIPSSNIPTLIKLNITHTNNKTIHYIFTPLKNQTMGIINSETPNYLFSIESKKIIPLLYSLDIIMSE